MGTFTRRVMKLFAGLALVALIYLALASFSPGVLGASAPAVTTAAASGLSSTGATLNGSVNPNGSDTLAWFEWGTSSTLTTYSYTPSQSVGAGTTSVAISAALSSLTANTIYYYRAAASNAAGTAKGTIVAFGTGAPVVTTGAVSAVSSTGATLPGIVNPFGSATTAWFEWGTSSTLTTYTQTALQSIGSGISPVPISAPLSGLTLNTAYYYRAAASNAVGTTRGTILSFTLLAPSVTTSGAAGISTYGATLYGSVNPNGWATTAWFEWGTSSTLATYTQTASYNYGSGTTSTAMSWPLASLAANTTYYYRAAASNAVGTTRGTILSFTTLPPPVAPSVTTWSASFVSSTGATLNGWVSPNGSATVAWFEWGTSSTLTTYSSTPSQSVGSTSVATSAALVGLVSNTTYYFRLAAQNAAGTTKGTIGGFVTLPATAGSIAITNLNPPSVTLIPGGAAQAVSILLSRTNYTGSITLAVGGALPLYWSAAVTQQPGTGNIGTISFQAYSYAQPASQSVLVTASGTGANPGSANLSVNVMDGLLTVGSTQAAPGLTANIPVTLSLRSGISIDALAFGIKITPAYSGTLTFTRDSTIPNAPSLIDTGTPGVISVAWLGNLSPTLGGTKQVGVVSMTIPSSATFGQTYTVQFTDAPSASYVNGQYSLAAGPSATVTVMATTYLVGDVAPWPSFAGDLNGDGDFDDVGEFGDGAGLYTNDLINGLRAVTKVPGYRPPACSDRFDAIDSFPVDTGGDGLLGTVDLIVTLRRVTGVDVLRPRRSPRGLTCPEAGLEALSRPPESDTALTQSPGERGEPAAASLSFGAAELGSAGGVRIPVYLRARTNLALAGLSFSVGLSENDREQRLRFTPSAGRAPTLIDDALPGTLAVAWLDGFWAWAGAPVLLGYAEVPGADAWSAPSLVVYGLVGDTLQEGRSLRFDYPATPPQRGRSLQ